MQSVSSDVSGTDTVLPSQTAYLEITGFTIGYEEAAVNVVDGILTQYKHYGSFLISRVSQPGTGLAMVIIKGPRDYLLEALDFLAVNKPQYLTITVRMTLA